MTPPRGPASRNRSTAGGAGSKVLPSRAGTGTGVSSPPRANKNKRPRTTPTPPHNAHANVGFGTDADAGATTMLHTTTTADLDVDVDVDVAVEVIPPPPEPMLGVILQNIVQEMTTTSSTTTITYDSVNYDNSSYYEQALDAALGKYQATFPWLTRDILESYNNNNNQQQPPASQYQPHEQPQHEHQHPQPQYAQHDITVALLPPWQLETVMDPDGDVTGDGNQQFAIAGGAENDNDNDSRPSDDEDDNRSSDARTRDSNDSSEEEEEQDDGEEREAEVGECEALTAATATLNKKMCASAGVMSHSSNSHNEKDNDQAEAEAPSLLFDPNEIFPTKEEDPKAYQLRLTQARNYCCVRFQDLRDNAKQYWGAVMQKPTVKRVDYEKTLKHTCEIFQLSISSSSGSGNGEGEHQNEGINYQTELKPKYIRDRIDHYPDLASKMKTRTTGLMARVLAYEATPEAMAATRQKRDEETQVLTQKKNETYQLKQALNWAALKFQAVRELMEVSTTRQKTPRGLHAKIVDLAVQKFKLPPGLMKAGTVKSRMRRGRSLLAVNRRKTGLNRDQEWQRSAEDEQVDTMLAQFFHVAGESEEEEEQQIQQQQGQDGELIPVPVELSEHETKARQKAEAAAQEQARELAYTQRVAEARQYCAQEFERLKGEVGSVIEIPEPDAKEEERTSTSTARTTPTRSSARSTKTTSFNYSETQGPRTRILKKVPDGAYGAVCREAAIKFDLKDPTVLKYRSILSVTRSTKEVQFAKREIDFMASSSLPNRSTGSSGGSSSNHKNKKRRTSTSLATKPLTKQVIL
jgi:hypothetical protein